MSLATLLPMFGLVFNAVGLIACLIGLHLARRAERRTLGYGLAVAGFLIAAGPLLAQLFGLVEPSPAEALPPR